MSAFQVSSHAITYTMAKLQHNVFACIEDYVIFTHRDKANGAFNDVFHLLKELCLPLNVSKLESPSRLLTCLNTCVNLDNNNP